ncbi:hypothetical protein Taro_048212 [Colocasia esculenta]|uniref:Uncharacterized protein n=1 Tax=Colocasia esculenta TaxID=4460 RepID=A0A843X851_COLES|nr:hypothetical protein [Colocasia esculenta]
MDRWSRIWFEDDVRLLQVEGEKVVGGDLLPFLHLYHWQEDPRPLHLYHWQQRNHRFTEHSGELRARSTWTTTARANFKHLLYNVRRNAERVCASIDKNQWKEHGPVWMRKEYWMELCVIWGGEKWNENSAKAKLNRATHPEANVHTSGSVSFATHKARLSYSRGMDERYRDNSQRLELDPDIWVAASGEPKKGHVYGFGHRLGMARVISSCSSFVSHTTSSFTTPAAPGGSSNAAPTMTPAQFREIVNETVSQNISAIVSQTVSQMLTQLEFLGDRAPPAQQPMSLAPAQGIRPPLPSEFFIISINKKIHKKMNIQHCHAIAALCLRKLHARSPKSPPGSLRFALGMGTLHTLHGALSRLTQKTPSLSQPYLKGTNVCFSSYSAKIWVAEVV